jgi:acyl carrier protein
MLAEYLPDNMIPSRLVALSELPRLPNGKIDRQQLRHIELEQETIASDVRPVVDGREQALISLWEGLLGRTGISPSANFFELGGHSLLVVEMTMAIERDFEVALTAADVFENPTVHELSQMIEQRGGSGAPPYRHLFPIQPGGRENPFIVAIPHFFTEMFARRFRGERPVYGLRGVSLRPEGNRGQWQTMTDLGEELADEIQRRFPDETCILAGYSFGASMAIETVRVMEGRGIPVQALYLIAPMPMDIYRLGPFRVQLDGLKRPVGELSVGEAMWLYARGNSPLTRRPYSRALRRLVILPWRRLLSFIGTLRGLIGLQLTPSILHADVRAQRFRLQEKYRPGHVRTPTVIFNADETETDAAATWRPYFRGPFTVVQTPDPHAGDASVEKAREVILRHLTELEDP